MLHGLLDDLLGRPSFRRISFNLARLGLHGLGVGLSPNPEASGELHFLRHFVRACGCQAALDVGANVGDYTAMLLGIGVQRVATFEPVPGSHERLVRRLGGDGRVTLHNLAVGERVGSVILNIPTDSETSVLASRGEGASAFTAAPLRAVEVPMTTLDTFVEASGATFDFLKIDVEGYEAEVLAGAQALIASEMLKAVQFEVSYHHLPRGSTLLAFERLLPGYRLFRVASRSLRPVDTRHYLGTIYGFSNIVALRPDVERRLSALI